MQAAATGLRTTGLGPCPGDSSHPARLTAASCCELCSAGLDRHSTRWVSAGPHAPVVPAAWGGTEAGPPLRPWRMRPPRRPIASASPLSRVVPPPRARQPRRERGPLAPGPPGPALDLCPQQGPLALPSGWSDAWVSGLQRRVDSHGVRGNVLH